MKPILPLPPYHPVYFIIKLFRNNLMLLRLKDYSIFIELFIDTPQLLHESQTSLLFTKY
jgi:hypothetical protein